MFDTSKHCQVIHKTKNHPMNITTITRSLTPSDLANAYANLHPDIERTGHVETSPLEFLVPTEPLDAGLAFHRLLTRMQDRNPLSNHEKALLPWLTALRVPLRQLGVRQMDAEADLRPFRGTPHGICDLLVTGGPAPQGVIEVKVITTGSVAAPRDRDLAQLGSYARLVARNRNYKQVWAGVAYVELRHRRVKLYGYSNVRKLVLDTTDLLAA